MDDDPLACTLVRVLLERRGWSVEAVRTLTDAKRWLREAGAGTNGRELPGLVITDVHLRDGIGIELAQWAKASGVLGSIPVWVFSADESVAIRQAAIDSGADRFVTKANFPREIEHLPGV
ncbi:MAG: response regulator [Phycisphaerales bacterium]|nr:response regulator [Phycisphaerales bacterium]